MLCYDNIVLAGDLSIDFQDPDKDTSNHLSDLCLITCLITCF